MARSATGNWAAGAGRTRRRRRLVRLLLVLGVIGVLGLGAAAWLHRTLPRIAAREIGRLMNARVEMGAFALRRDGSVLVTGLVVRPQQAEALYDNTILRADNVYAKFSRRSLFSLSPRVTDIRVEDFLLDAQLNFNTARWNIGTLRFNAPGGGGGGGLPAISLQRGKLRYCRISGVRQEVVMSIPIEARFGRDIEGDPSYSFEVKTAKLSGGYGDSRLSGRWRPGAILTGPGYALTHAAELTIAGGLSSTDIPSLERAWAVDVLAGELKYDPQGNYSLTLNLNNVHGRHAPEVDTLRFLAPVAGGAEPLRSLQEFFTEYQPTGTVGAITLKASGNLKRWNQSEIEGKVVCKDISICDKDFPYPLDHLSGELEFTQSTVRIKRLVGQHGPVEVCLDGWTKGLGLDRQYQYQITSRNMILDQALYAALNPGQKRFWDALHPTGTVSVDYRQTRTSPTDRRWTLAVDLNDVAAAFQGFPYPLTGLTGTLFFDRKSILLSDVVSRTGGRQIRMNGRVTEHSSATPAYYISLEAKDLPLDATLRDALPAQHRELFRRFDVNGLADVRARIFSTSAAPLNAPTDVNAVAQAQPVPMPGGSSAMNSAPADNPDSALSHRVSFLADVSCRKSSLKLPCSGREPGGQAPTPVALKTSAPSGPADGKPLVLSDITAEMTVTPDSLSIQHLEGRQGRSPVTITGGLRFGAGATRDSGAQGRDLAPGSPAPTSSLVPESPLQQCRVKIVARKVALDEAMFDLLPPTVAPQVAAFHPSGEVGLVVELQKPDSNEPLAWAVAVECLGGRIQHECFPYPLQDIRGTISFAENKIVLKNVTAKPEEAQTTDSGLQQTTETHPPATIRIEGSLTLSPNAPTPDRAPPRGSFTLQTTNLRFTESLGRALPNTWAGLYRELSPQGSFDLHGTTLKVFRSVDGATSLEVGGQARLGSPPPSKTAGGSPQPCELRVSGTAVGLSGVLDAEISWNAKRGLDKGRVQLAADTLVVQGKTITHADMDAVYDPNARKWTATNFVGDCYRGKLLGSLEVGVSEDSRPTAETGETPSSVLRPLSSGLEYQLQVALHAVDLQQFLLAGGKKETGAPKAQDGGPLSSVLSSSSSASSGLMDASLSLRARIGDPRRHDLRSESSQDHASARAPGATGDGPGRSGRRGVCRVHIANMQVGRVSPLGHVLSVLRLSEPTDYTFERMLMDSYVRDDKLLISKLDLSGRNAAFVGAGTLDLPTEEINLTLTGRGPRLVAGVPSVLQSLTEGLSGAVARIEVTGKAGSPEVQTKALPVIEDSLRILGTPEESRKGKK